MSVRFAVIRNRESDKNVAVVAHDSEIGRVVIKCRDTDWPLQRAFDFWIDRALVTHEPHEIGATKITIRRKVVRFDPDYLDYLLDRFVKRPYDVRVVVESKSTIRLDDIADQKANEMIGG